MGLPTPASRTAKTVLVVIAAAILGQLWLVVLFRLFHRRRAVLLTYEPFRRLLKTYNAATRNVAGTRHSSHGLLRHTGRKSGRNYQTSLGVNPYGDGFLVPLTYGPGTDWFRNLKAAGGWLEWKGETFQVERPEVVTGPEPMSSWPTSSRIMLQVAGIEEFALLHQRK